MVSRVSIIAVNIRLKNSRPNVMVTSGWFGVAATAFVTSTELSYIEPG